MFQRCQIFRQISSLGLTFNLNRDGVADAAHLITGHADVVSRILIRHRRYTQGFIEVLKSDLSLWQIPSFLKPFDYRSWTVSGSERTCVKRHNFAHKHQNSYLVCFIFRITHTPAAIHSRRSSSPWSTILELDIPEGERKVGVDS